MIDYRPVTTGFGEPTRGGPVQRDMLYLRESRAFAAALLPDQHAARVESLGNGVAGVMRAGKVAIHAVGAAYASLKGIKTKSGIKQVDRLLSNEKVNVNGYSARGLGSSCRRVKEWSSRSTGPSLIDVNGFRRSSAVRNRDAAVCAPIADASALADGPLPRRRERPHRPGCNQTARPPTHGAEATPPGTAPGYSPRRSIMETVINNSISTFDSPTPEALAAHWGPNAPRGARAVLTRIVKEGANVPLFLGQTLVNALRDLGYNDTTSAICEHVDNAAQWGANEIRIYFNEVGKKNEKKIDVLVYDNGVGMAPNVLRAVTAFGGSLCFENREGIGRYGMGMKAAALSISPRLEIYSWQESGAIYNMDLDVRDLANDKGNVVYLPEPELVEKLPADVRDILTSQMSHPRNSSEAQYMFSEDADELTERLGKSGTIIYMPGADRLTTRQVKRLVDSATRQMARIYRRHIAKGLRLFVNNRRVDPFDPTYFMPEARHTSVPGLTETRSRLVNSWPIEIPEEEEAGTTHKVMVRLYLLPFEDWNDQPRKVLKNDLHVFDTGVSFMRSNREVQYGPVSALTGRTSRDHWWRLEIEFPPELDEAFGVAVNKQGVRPKGYVIDKIGKEIAEELASVRRRIEQLQSERAVQQKKGKQSAAEQRANEAESLQSHPLTEPIGQSEEEKKELEARLRELAVAYKRPDESDDEAVERVRGSKFIMATRHDEGPFYAAESRLGKVILTINTGHPFFEHVYKPLADLAKLSEGGGGEEGVNLDPDLIASSSQLVVKLQLTLLALARTQAQMAATEPEHRKLFDQLRKNWSHALDAMLVSG